MGGASCYGNISISPDQIVNAVIDGVTHDSMSTLSGLQVEGDGLGSMPGPRMLILNFKNPFV